MELVNIDENNIAKSKPLEDIHYKELKKEKLAQKIWGGIIGAVLGAILGHIIGELMLLLAIGAIIGGVITGKEKNVNKSLLSDAKDVEQYINIDIPKLRAEIKQAEEILKQKQYAVMNLKTTEQYQLALSVLSEKYLNHQTIEVFIEILKEVDDKEYSNTVSRIISDAKNKQNKSQECDADKESKDIFSEIRRGVNSTHCPHCGETQCIPTTEITTKGYGYGKGCCGLLFFGPLGLLFGLCGKDVKSATWWNCSSCGKKHRSYEEVELLLEQFVASTLCWVFFLGTLVKQPENSYNKYQWREVYTMYISLIL